MENLLIKNVMIVTMEGQKEIINRGYIRIEGNKIVEVKEGNYTGNSFEAEVIDGINCAALPGLINCHTHIPMTLLRGYGEGLPLMKWLNEKIWPFEAKLNDDDIEYGATLGMLEMIKSGTTCFVDMYYKERVIGNTASKIGMRAYLGSPLIGDAWEAQLNETIELNKVFDGNELITIMVAPHSPYTCSYEALKKAGEAARKYRMPAHIHIAETLEEVDIVEKQYGMTPVEFCESTGIYADNNLIAAHCVHISKKDIDIIKKYNFNVVHNPQSNMKLASGIAPIIEIQKSGINVCLGTDGASSNNNLNMIEEMQTASLLHKVHNGDPTVLSGYETIKLATVNAARALGLSSKLGRIKEGFLADLILIDLSKPHMKPLHDVYSNIVFSCQGSDVRDVIINGKVVMKNNKACTIDEHKIVSCADERVREIIERK